MNRLFIPLFAMVIGIAAFLFGLVHVALTAERLIFDDRATGFARVIDGDGIEIDGHSIRIAGIDAPETYRNPQPGGDTAKAIMASIVDGKTVTCERQRWDRHDRWIAICDVGGADLGRALVAAGAAWNHPRYDPDYVNEQASARARKAGIWKSKANIPPWIWRRNR